MGASLFLITVFQMVLIGGVGGVAVTKYALSGLLKDERAPTPSFPSDYHELMWLAQRQRRHADRDETRRFIRLRQEWQAMHLRK